MKLTTQNLLPLAVVVAVGGAGLYLYFRGAAGVAKDVAKGATGVVTGAATGVVTGIGESLGIPETDKTECQKALAEGRTWDASFLCSAGDFLRGVFGGSKSTTDQQQVRTDAELVADATPVAGRFSYP